MEAVTGVNTDVISGVITGVINGVITGVIALETRLVSKGGPVKAGICSCPAPAFSQLTSAGSHQGRGVTHSH